MTAVVILVGNYKGGVGKTLTTAYLAEILAVDYGETVTAVDMDRQGGLTDWWTAAHNEGRPTSFGLEHVVGATVDRAIERATERATVVLIDAAPGDRPAFIAAARRADIVVIPTKAQAADWVQAVRARQDLLDHPDIAADVFCLATMVREGLNTVAEITALLAEEQDGRRVGLARKIPQRDAEAADVFCHRPVPRLPGGRGPSGLWIAYQDVAAELSDTIARHLAAVPA